MKIITNHQPRDLVALNDLPLKVQQDFDYVREAGDYSPRFVQYKGTWYDTCDTQRIDSRNAERRMGWAIHVRSDDPLAAWDSVLSDTYFSGVLFKFVGYEAVIVGRYFA